MRLYGYTGLYIRRRTITKMAIQRRYSYSLRFALLLVLSTALFIGFCSCQSSDDVAAVVGAEEIEREAPRPLLMPDDASRIRPAIPSSGLRRITERDASCCIGRPACVAACWKKRCWTGYCSGHCGTCECSRCFDL